jgi:HAE1 family hydrophobic/amphiphilic exporter-1
MGLLIGRISRQNGQGLANAAAVASLSDRFIRSPVLTIVCSQVILLIGGVAIPLLPLEKLPQLARTQIQVSATNICADACTNFDTVTRVLEK